MIKETATLWRRLQGGCWPAPTISSDTSCWRRTTPPVLKMGMATTTTIATKRAANRIRIEEVAMHNRGVKEVIDPDRSTSGHLIRCILATSERGATESSDVSHDLVVTYLNQNRVTELSWFWEWLTYSAINMWSRPANVKLVLDVNDHLSRPAYCWWMLKFAPHEIIYPGQVWWYMIINECQGSKG